jgi:hypothetical protein
MLFAVKTKTHSRTFGVVALILGVSLAGMFWLDADNARARSAYRRGILEFAAGSFGRVGLPAPATALSLTWQKGTGPPGASLRVRDRGRWSGWIPVPMDEDAATGPGPRAGSQLLFGSSITAAQYRVAPNDARNIRLVAIDGRDRRPLARRLGQGIAAAVRRMTPSAVAQGEPAVISRADWGADESLRMSADGSPTWPLQYAPVTHFIVHHTVTSDGTPDRATADQIVRSIYLDHAVARQWGDIGYNYLIDAAGNVFEGRYGGDGVVAGHAYRDAACSFKGPEASFNVGTVGVALLGNFQTGVPSVPATDALTRLIGWKARDFGVDPTAVSQLVDAVYPAVIGHRDVDCTLCPGDNLYAEMAAQRLAAKDFRDSLPPLPTPVRAATFLSQSDALVTAKAGESATVTVDVKNDSNVTWRSYVADRPQLLLTDAAPSLLAHAAWSSPTTPGELVTPNVPPGGIGRFVFSVTAPTTAFETVGHFAIQWGGAQLAGTGFAVTVRSTGLPYAGVLTESNVPKTVFAGGKRHVTVFYQNLGVNPWNPGEVRLAVTSATGTANAFRTRAWPKGSRFDLPGAAAPNATTRVSLPIQIPKSVGNRTWAFWLERSDGTPVLGSRVEYVTRVDSPYQMQLHSETIPVAMRSGWRKRVRVTVQNTGIINWGSDVRLRIRENGRAPTLADRSWLVPTGNFRADRSRVPRGGSATFTFLLKAPKATGVHRLNLELISVSDSKRVYQKPVEIPVRIDP